MKSALDAPNLDHIVYICLAGAELADDLSTPGGPAGNISNKHALELAGSAAIMLNALKTLLFSTSSPRGGSPGAL